MTKFLFKAFSPSANCPKTAHFRAKIAQLEKEKAQLRAFLSELIEAYYRAINQESASSKKRSEHE